MLKLNHHQRKLTHVIYTQQALNAIAIANRFEIETRARAFFSSYLLPRDICHKVAITRLADSLCRVQHVSTYTHWTCGVRDTHTRNILLSYLQPVEFHTWRRQRRRRRYHTHKGYLLMRMCVCDPKVHIICVVYLHVS